MKVLVIGAAGFVGGHLIDYLGQIPEVNVFASKLSSERIENVSLPSNNIFDLDILNQAGIESLLNKVYPDYIIHLAAQSSVAYSWKDPSLTINVNLIGTINVLESLRKTGLASRILLIGSAEQYGNIKASDLPINENLRIEPYSPYAISKVSQEMFAHLYHKAYNMEIIMVRAFNHIGSGQSETFAIPNFAKQIAEIEKGVREPIILVGNLEVKRDFTDVRDIVRGYWKLVTEGVSGEVYNIGSGTTHSLKSLLNKMIEKSAKDILIQIDPSKFRPVDIPVLCADISKIRNHIHWEPQIPMDRTLADILDYWRTKCLRIS